MPESIEEQTGQQVDLKDPALAAFLAWLIPGLGHLYQGRFGKAGLFFVCIMGTFLYGLYLGSQHDLGWGRVVYYSWRPGDKRLPYLCQVGVGLPALPALVQASRMKSDKQVWWGGFMAPPRRPEQFAGANMDQPTLPELNRKLNRGFELGTVYTMIAGLLNVLAVYDAWGGPVFSETARKEEDEEGAEGEEDEEHSHRRDEGAPTSLTS
ncbi:MAG: hypothetical protein JXB62_08720 [Pirellulales bacterium]|nr:hypothetical protein [Pirellulales bacterium]